MEKKKTYYKGLDILRVVFCIAVLLYHFGLLKGGFLAVCSFFVLTGYLSVVSQFNKEKFSLWHYYKSRLLHIYLPLIVVVFISIIMVSFMPDNNWINIKPETYSVLGGYNNFWQLSANLDYFARHVSSPFMHFWYIGILLQFELVFPFLFIILKKLGDKIGKFVPCFLSTVLAIGATVLFYYMSKSSPIMVVYYNTFARMFSIFFGVALGFIVSYYGHLVPKFISKSVVSKIILTIYIIGSIVLFVLVDANSKYFVYLMILITLMTVRMIDYSTIKDSNGLSPFDKLIKSLASVSYEVYLVQYPVIFLFQYSLMSSFIKIPLMIVIIMVISYILHYAFSNSKRLIGVKYILKVAFVAATLFGIYEFVKTKDFTMEMQELQNQLAENEKVMAQKQEEYAAKLKEQEELWASELADLEDGEAKIAEMVEKLPIVCIGDSVMLGAVPNLSNRFTNGYFDAKISRTDYVVEGILKDLKSSNSLGEPIVLNFGANGDCRNNKCKDNLMKVAGDRDVFWMTVTNDKDVHFNSRIKEYAEKYPNLHIIDWESISKGHSEYFYKDGLHLTEPGRKAYVKAVYDAIYNLYLEQYKKKKEEAIKKHEEELKSKISFFGNNLLIGAFNDLQEGFEDAKFVYNKDYDFASLKEELTKEIDEGTLNYNVVLAFDNTVRFSLSEYKELVDLCKDKKLYVVKTIEKMDVPEEVTIIDFYTILKDNSDYLVRDSSYLSASGNKALTELINKTFNVVLEEDTSSKVEENEKGSQM